MTQQTDVAFGAKFSSMVIFILQRASFAQWSLSSTGGSDLISNFAFVLNKLIVRFISVENVTVLWSNDDRDCFGVNCRIYFV